MATTPRQSRMSILASPVRLTTAPTGAATPTPPTYGPSPFDGLVPSPARYQPRNRLTLPDLSEMSPFAGLVPRPAKPSSPPRPAKPAKLKPK